MTTSMSAPLRGFYCFCPVKEDFFHFFIFLFWLLRCTVNLNTVLGLYIEEGHNDSFTLPTVLCCRTADLLNCAMLGWIKYCCSTFVPSASPDEVTDVDRDKEVGCGERGKRWGGERRARCWEVQVTWWAPGPCGGGCTLPLSYIYPLAAARQADWVDGGRCGEDAGAPMGMREKVSELGREM